MESTKINFIFSIIIPCIGQNDFLHKTFDYILKSKFAENTEIIIVSDNEMKISEKYKHLNIKIFQKNLSPSEKRNFGACISKGKFLAFIDDDAYPSDNWLDVAHNFFISNKDIFVIGGPGIHISNNQIHSIAIRLLFTSKFTIGFPERYVSYGKIKKVNDWPSVNLFVAREVFLKLKGFNTSIWPGEDSHFCNELVEAGYKIFYLPSLIVYHSPRQSFLNLFRQIARYSYVRGYLFKNKIKNSIKLFFLIPSLFFIFNLASLFYFLTKNLFFYELQIVETLFLFIYFLYFMMLLISIKDFFKIEKKIYIYPLTFFLTFLVQNIYGFNFIRGIFSIKFKFMKGR